MSLTIWLVDPVHLTPYYDAAICAALVDAGCTVRCITSRFLYDPALVRTDIVDYLYFRGLNQRSLLHYPQLRRLLRLFSYPLGHYQLLKQIQAAPPDIVHIQWSRVPFLDRLLIARIRALGIPIVHTIHDVVPLFDDAQTVELVTLYGQVNRLLVHTNANRLALQKQHPDIPVDQISVIPHINLYRQFPCAGDRAVARRILGIPAEVPVILFFGSIRPYKGLDILIQSYLQARQTRPDLWLIVAGYPQSADVAQVLSQLDAHSTVKLSYIPSDRVWVYHCAADVAVFPYRQISQSGALVTAMGFGLPVIVTDVGGMPETVDGNGWIVPSGDVAALARALVDSTSDKPLLDRRGHRSLQLLQERHSAALVARQTIKVYEELIHCGVSSTVSTA